MSSNTISLKSHIKHPFSHMNLTHQIEITTGSKVQSVVTGIIVGTLLAGTFIAVYFLTAKISFLTLLITSPSTAIIGGTTSLYAVAYFKKTQRVKAHSEDVTKKARSLEEAQRRRLLEVEQQRNREISLIHTSCTTLQAKSHEEADSTHNFYICVSTYESSETNLACTTSGYFSQEDAREVVDYLNKFTGCQVVMQQQDLNMAPSKRANPLSRYIPSVFFNDSGYLQEVDSKFTWTSRLKR